MRGSSISPKTTENRRTTAMKPNLQQGNPNSLVRISWPREHEGWWWYAADNNPEAVYFLPVKSFPPWLGPTLESRWAA